MDISIDFNPLRLIWGRGTSEGKPEPAPTFSENWSFLDLKCLTEPCPGGSISP